MKFRDKFYKFMYGRNGADALYHFLMAIAGILIIVAFFLKDILKDIFVVAGIVILVLAYFRVFSKNIYKRRNENEKFKNFFKKIASFFKINYNKIKYRKQYYYVKCKECKKILRYKRIAGEHNATCPNCGFKFIVKIRGNK